MKFVISTQELNHLISKCLNVVPVKAPMPILSNILIEAINDELIFTATDLTVGIRCFTEAKIFEEGAISVPAKKFSQLIKELTAVNLEISTSQNNVVEILADSSSFKLNGMPKDEFPALPPLNEATQLSVNQKELKEMFFQTSFAVSREDNRYTLTGVSLNISNGSAVFVGTDGKRLSRAHMQLEGVDPQFTGSYILPLKAVEEIQKNLFDQGAARLYLMKDKIALQSGQMMVISKLLAGDYPDVTRVIPQASEFAILLHREELITLLRQISLFTTEASNSVRFTFTKGQLKLTANTQEIGEGKVSMPANFHDSKMEIAFNPTFFLDILRHCQEETVILSVTDPYSPGSIAEGSKTPSLEVSPLFVLMPMRLNEE